MVSVHLEASCPEWMFPVIVGVSYGAGHSQAGRRPFTSRGISLLLAESRPFTGREQAFYWHGAGLLLVGSMPFTSREYVFYW